MASIDGRRIRWGIFAACTLGGAALVAGGWLVTESYLQDGLLSVGTALLLFGFLFLAEQRILAAVEEPQNLSEAQRALADEVASARQRGGAARGGALAGDARQAAVRRAFKQLHAAGLRQVQPSGGSADRIHMHDGSGLGVTWTLAWDPPGLRHVVTLSSEGGTDLISARPARALGDGVMTSVDQRSIRDFEDETFELLREILRRLRRRRDSGGAPLSPDDVVLLHHSEALG